MTSLSLYIHTPFCRKRCAYCSFVSYAGRESEIYSYVDSLRKEILMRRIQVSGINTIYFGGGTPSLLPAKSLENILDTIKNNYFIQEDAEITLEANPGTIDPEYLQSALSIGINRLSIGIQSLDEIELNLLGRIHSSGEARDALHQAKTAGFNNISVDFIYGIPLA